MTLTDMETRVRRDLKDESEPQRFTDDDIDRAIARALTELAKYSPYQQIATIATTDASDEIDISEIENIISLDRVEYPVGETPRVFVRFEYAFGILRFLETEGDGEDCNVYYSTVHTLDATSSTIPTHLEDLVALGATGYAALVLSQYATDKSNYGGENVDRDYLYWAKGRVMEFENGLKKLNRKAKQNVLYSS